MSSPLSNELFFKAHRGLLIRTSMGKKVDTENLGIHWSANPDKAEEFASRHIHWPDRTGYVYHGEIPMSSVETDSNRLMSTLGHGWDRSDLDQWRLRDTYGEKEVPVKENAPIKVTGRTTYKRKPRPEGGSELKSRKRTYNPPREMKA